MFFAYGEKEITYLKQKDKRLAEIIDKIGMIERDRFIFSRDSSYHRSADFNKSTGNHLETNEGSVWYH